VGLAGHVLLGLSIPVEFKHAFLVEITQILLTANARATTAIITYQDYANHVLEEQPLMLFSFPAPQFAAEDYSGSTRLALAQ
jgi:hypothetical protein